MNPTILLKSGNYFNFKEPETTPLCIDDISWGLSNVCRYAGQCKFNYNVASHSIMVADLVLRYMEARNEINLYTVYAALMHDASESVLGDVPTPLKMLLPDYKAIEERTENMIRSTFGIINYDDPLIKQMDALALGIEKAQLFDRDDNPDEWCGVPTVSQKLIEHYKISEFGQKYCYEMFLEYEATLRAKQWNF